MLLWFPKKKEYITINWLLIKEGFELPVPISLFREMVKTSLDSEKVASKIQNILLDLH